MNIQKNPYSNLNKSQSQFKNRDSSQEGNSSINIVNQNNTTDTRNDSMQLSMSDIPKAEISPGKLHIID